MVLVRWVLAASLLIADAVTTAVGLRLGATERTPGAAWVLDRWGEVAMHAVASVLIVLMVAGAEWGRRRLPPAVSVLAVHGAVLVLGVKAVAVANNVAVIHTLAV